MPVTMPRRSRSLGFLRGGRGRSFEEEEVLMRRSFRSGILKVMDEWHVRQFWVEEAPRVETMGTEDGVEQLEQVGVNVLMGS